MVKIKFNKYICWKLVVMNNKLTLTLEEEVIKIAKVYAMEKGQSLSEIVENHFKFITMERVKHSQKELSPKINKLRGILKTEKGFDYKKVLTEELSKKHGI